MKAKPAKPWRIPLFFSGVLLLSQAFPLPSPVVDLASGSWPTNFFIHYPFWHQIFSPFCGLADRLTTFSLKESIVFLAYVVAGLSFLKRWRQRFLAFALFLLFIAWGALVPRPMGRLWTTDPDVLLIDFHSHTRVSHDGRPSFTPEANRAWHWQQGYHAGFITDHNRVESAQEAKQQSRLDWRQTGYRSLEGEEVSLYKTHLVVLGNHERIDNQPYDSDTSKIPLFLAAMRQRGYPVIASSPEYWLYHWGEDVPRFVQWGISGFEILNSAPKALDMPASYRREIVELCREKNLSVMGISDNHGYGYATSAWNAMRIPGWPLMDPDQLEKAVLQTLSKQGFNAVHVLARAKFIPSTRMELLFSPLINLGVYWRSLQPAQVASWIGWLWLACLFL